MATTPHDNQPIEAGEEANDTDSTLGFDTTSETESLSSMVLRFEFENGRRYHSYQSGRYAFPNDEDELDRMDFEHHIFTLLLYGELHLAPLRNRQRILDLGTGSGIWAVAVADKYPSASVVGTDLSPVQPNMVPPNLQFEVDDFEQEWLFQKDSFDLIHSRILIASISDYPRLFHQALRHLKPGGYLEMHDIDPNFYSDDETIPEDSSAVNWSNLFSEGCEKVGRRIPTIMEYKPMMEDAGFVDVEIKIVKRPSNTWPKDMHMKRIGLVRARLVSLLISHFRYLVPTEVEINKYTLTNHLNGIHGFSIGLFTRVLGWAPLEVEVLLAKCRKEWRDTSIHGYQKL